MSNVVEAQAQKIMYRVNPDMYNKGSFMVEMYVKDFIIAKGKEIYYPLAIGLLEKQALDIVNVLNRAWDRVINVVWDTKDLIRCDVCGDFHLPKSTEIKGTKRVCYHCAKGIPFDNTVIGLRNAVEDTLVVPKTELTQHTYMRVYHESLNQGYSESDAATIAHNYVN